MEMIFEDLLCLLALVFYGGELGLPANQFDAIDCVVGTSMTCTASTVPPRTLTVTKDIIAMYLFQEIDISFLQAFELSFSSSDTGYTSL